MDIKKFFIYKYEYLEERAKKRLEKNPKDIIALKDLVRVYTYRGDKKSRDEIVATLSMPKSLRKQVYYHLAMGMYMRDEGELDLAMRHFIRAKYISEDDMVRISTPEPAREIVLTKLLLGDVEHLSYYMEDVFQKEEDGCEILELSMLVSDFLLRVGGDLRLIYEYLTKSEYKLPDFGFVEGRIWVFLRLGRVYLMIGAEHGKDSYFYKRRAMHYFRYAFGYYEHVINRYIEIFKEGNVSFETLKENCTDYIQELYTAVKLCKEYGMPKEAQEYFAKFQREYERLREYLREEELLDVEK